jgi:hypothetical protein
MTEDEVAVTMATRSGAMTAADWSDFFSMARPQQEFCARLYRDAIWDNGGPSAWDAALAVLGTAATIFGEASGIGTAFQVLKGLI